MLLTEKEHRKLAALMDQAARRKGLSQAQREDYLFKAKRFRYLARRAKAQADDHQPRSPRSRLRLVETDGE